MKRKMLAIVLTLCMVLSMMPTVAFAAGDDFHDIDGHWAEEVIEKWADRNIVSGMGNNQFNPNGEMTRAQAAAVFANFFGLSKKADVSHFTDVEDAWYKDAIAMCVEAGIMSGVGNGKMDPHGTLTREQMFTMFANGLGLKPEPTSEKEFADDHKTSGWAQGFVNALVNRGYVSGMGGNKLAPDQEINRASVMALIDSTVAEYVTESGATVEAPKDGGIVIVVADDVTIIGELSGTVLAVGGDTNITVEKATADAEVIVASGSENVTVAGEFAGTVTVAANDTTVTVENATEEAKVVVNAENTTVEGEIKGTVEVADGATGTTVAAETAKVEVTGESATVEVTGKVETVEVKETAAGSSVEVAKDATVTTVKTEAAESTVNVAGTVKDVEVSEKAGNTTVTTESTAKVENVKTEAAGTTVAGEGKVEKVEATENATGTTVNTNGSAVENNSKEDVTVGTGTVGSGSTGTSAGETSKPTEGTTTPSTGGSSSSSSSKPAHSHTYGAWATNNNGTHTRPSTCGHSAETKSCTYGEDGVCTVCGFKQGAVAMIGETYYTTLADAITAGGEITLFAGNHVWPDVVVPDNLTIVGEDGATIAAGEGINRIVATNITVDNVDFTAATGDNTSSYIALQVVGSGTFKNCNISGSYGVRKSDALGAVTFKDCNISGDVYAVHFNGGGKGTSTTCVGNVILDSCTLSGWTSFGTTGTVTIKDCTFEEHEQYNTLRFYQDATITGTTVNPKTSIEINDDKENVTVALDANCKVSDGSNIAARVKHVHPASSKITVDGTVVYVVVMDEDFVANMQALPTGLTEITLVDADGNTGLVISPAEYDSTITVASEEGFLFLETLYAEWVALFTDGEGNDYANYLNGAGADYYYGGRWTVSLEADIDLNNATIDPVTIKHPVSTGAPTFDGNNHTIKNAKIVTDATTQNEAGLFNASEHVALKNLKLDNIHVTGSNIGNSTAGILSGSVNANQGVQNITIINSSVTGGKYTGGVIGYGYTDVLNCTLTNVVVKGGYKLGGLVGYICADNSNVGDVTGNTLTDCTVDGNVDAEGNNVYAEGKNTFVIGRVVGNYNCNGTFKNNVVTDMTTSATNDIGKIEAGFTVTYE